MTPVRTAHGADPSLGRTALVALDIAERACAPDSAMAHDDVSGWRENMLSPAGAQRTDLCHGHSARSLPRLSILMPGSKQVVIEMMIHESDGLEGIMPSREERSIRSNARSAIAFARREIEAWLRDGDDQDAFRIARLAMRGSAHAVFDATATGGRIPPAEKLWFRHATSWSPPRIGMLTGRSELRWLSDVMTATAGRALPPPVTSIEFDDGGRDTRITIGPVIDLMLLRNLDPISAMRSLNEAHHAMRNRP